MIEHLILSGGGHNIITMFGAISYLINNNYFSIKNLKSVDGTSAGALLAFVLMLDIDNDLITNYIIDRPWEKLFNISAEIIFQAYQNRGLLDKSVFVELLKPLLKVADFDLNITMLELYKKTNIEFYIYTTEINSVECKIFSYLNSPNESVIELIYRSCTIPIIFKPSINDDENTCYIDGGVFANYPYDYFLSRNPDIKNENILGVKLIHENNENDFVNSESNISDFLFLFMKNLIKIQKKYMIQEINKKLSNELKLHCESISFSTLKKCIYEKEERTRLLEEGKKYATLFLSN